jgi:acyl-CoA thioester hydrolase
MSVGAEGVSRLRVRYSETDQMGVVYHANYLVWCEIGRTELMRHLGFAYAELERSGIRLAVTEASVRYIRAARYDDPIRVVARLEAARSRSVTFSYDILREDEEPPILLATASTRLIAIDGTGATRRLPDDLVRSFREIAASA